MWARIARDAVEPDPSSQPAAALDGPDAYLCIALEGRGTRW